MVKTSGPNQNGSDVSVSTGQDQFDPSSDLNATLPQHAEQHSNSSEGLSVQDAVRSSAMGISAPRSIEERDHTLQVIDALSNVRQAYGDDHRILEAVSHSLRVLYRETGLVDVRVAVLNSLEKIGFNDPETRVMLSQEAAQGDFTLIRNTAARTLNSLSQAQAA